MSFHTGQTFTYGETPSATKMQYLWDNDYALADGTGISDDAIIARHISGFDKSNLSTSDVNPYKFLAYVNTSVSVSNNAIIPFANEVFDSNNNFNTSTYKYTVPVTGFYQMEANAYIVSETAQPWCGFLKNGSKLKDGIILPTIGGANCAVQCSGIFSLAANDLIEVRRFNSASSAKNVYGTLAGLETSFGGFLVSRT